VAANSPSTIKTVTPDGLWKRRHRTRFDVDIWIACVLRFSQLVVDDRRSQDREGGGHRMIVDFPRPQL